jgi:hypothetical protein
VSERTLTIDEQMVERAARIIWGTFVDGGKLAKLHPLVQEVYREAARAVLTDLLSTYRLTLRDRELR